MRWLAEVAFACVFLVGGYLIAGQLARPCPPQPLVETGCVEHMGCQCCLQSFVDKDGNVRVIPLQGHEPPGVFEDRPLFPR